MVASMELFPPAHLPGVGMGDLMTVVGVGGLIGLATTSGALLANGLAGILLFVGAALLVLQEKSVFLGGQPEIVIGVLVALVLLGAIRLVLARRSNAAAVPGAPQAGSSAAPREAQQRSIRLLDLLAVLIGSATVGFAWAEWNEVPFAFADNEAIAGTLIGLACGAIGGHAASLFVSGSVRAGGHPSIIVGAVLLVAFALNALGLYVPFIGYLSLLLAAAFAVRLGRRSHKKYKGLRILT